MNNGTSIKQLMEMRIGQIHQLEVAQKLIHTVIEEQKASVKDAIEKTEVTDKWAEDFINNLN